MNYIVQENLINKRLDTAIPEIIDNENAISRNYAKTLIDDGNVLVNGKIQKASYKLKQNDEIDIDIPEPLPLNVEAEDIPLDIIYEDEHLLVVNKPKGMVVHPANGNYNHTLVNAIMYHCKNSLSSINGVIRPGIVHRIDKDTQGLLVVAKDNKTHEELASQFKEHSNKRKYIAVVNGIIKEDEGTIDANIARSKNDRKKMAVVPSNEGRKAITHFKVLNRLKNTTLVECSLETGRTHQIRVHMSYIHHPLLGDTLYGSKDDKKHGKGQMLAAICLGFIHPYTKEYKEFNIDIPEEFKKYLVKC